MKLLLLEDDTALAAILVDFLSEVHDVTHTYSMKSALELSERSSFDLYIFDINVADGDGISLLKELRSYQDQTPTIFITAFRDTKYLKSAFESGGDDFIKKPFDLEELEQRIERLKRHFGLETLVTLTQECSLNTQTHTLITTTENEEKKHTFTKRENDVLHYLFKNRHRVVSSQELLQNFWEYEDMPSDDAIRTIIKTLRRFVGKQSIVNIRGEGYKFE